MPRTPFPSDMNSRCSDALSWKPSETGRASVPPTARGWQTGAIFSFKFFSRADQISSFNLIWLEGSDPAKATVRAGRKHMETSTTRDCPQREARSLRSYCLQGNSSMVSFQECRVLGNGYRMNGPQLLFIVKVPERGSVSPRNRRTKVNYYQEKHLQYLPSEMVAALASWACGPQRGLCWISCSAVTTLKVLIRFKQGASYSYFVQNPTDDRASPEWLWCVGKVRQCCLII